MYSACLLTNGQIGVAFTGEQQLEDVLAAFSLVVSDSSCPRIAPLFTDFGDFQAQSDDVRQKQKTDPQGFNNRAKIVRRNAHRREIQIPQWAGADSSNPAAVRLRFACTPSFWERYKAGRKEFLKSFTLHGGEDRITKFGRSRGGVVAEGAAYLDLDRARVDILPQFEELGGVSAEFCCVQCYTPTIASAQIQFVWQRGLQLLNFAHSRGLKVVAGAPGEITAAMRAAAADFVRDNFDTPVVRGGHLQGVGARRVLFVTNLAYDRGEYARGTMVGRGEYARLASGVEAEKLLGVFLAFLTVAHGVDVIHFSKLGPAYATTLIQYLALELAKQVSEGKHYTEFPGM